MSLLAAAVPVAVLVLAWDEATPAVRALVEATETAAPALDSVVVLVPAEAGELTPEEFLPLAAELEPLPAASSPANMLEEPNEAAAAEEAVPLPSTPAALPNLLPLTEPMPVAFSALVAPKEIPPLAQVPPKVTALAPPTWSAVRVLHLSSFSLPELNELSSQALPRPIWQHSALPPAKPYLGSQAEVAESEASIAVAPTLTQLLPAAELPRQLTESALLRAPTPPATATPEQPLPALPVVAPDYLLTEPLLPALDAEADLAPILFNELATTEAAPTEAPLANAAGTAQAGWLEALASLRDPLPAEEPALAADLENEAAYYAATTGEQPVAGTGPAELRLVSQPFEAPNLNFQVIQYARFAVPVALAQAPFAVIYAPAWPTWLAAQELRQRTRQPLVLHVGTLAAGEVVSLDTATGWQAELQRQALYRADLILAETPELTRRLRHDLGLSPDLVRTVSAADAAAVAQALRTAQLRPSVSAS